MGFVVLVVGFANRNSPIGEHTPIIGVLTFMAYHTEAEQNILIAKKN